MSEIPNRWTCSYHGFTGRTDDDSYTRHCNEGHGGDTICVLWWRAHDCGYPEDSFGCKIRHIHLDTSWAKKDH